MIYKTRILWEPRWLAFVSLLARKSPSAPEIGVDRSPRRHCRASTDAVPSPRIFYWSTSGERRRISRTPTRGVPSCKAAGLMNRYQFFLISHQLEMHLAQTRIGNDAK